MIVDFIFDAIKSKIFGSKDYFERVKRRLVGSLVTPLFVIVGTPTILLSALSNIQYVEVNAYGSVIKFLGAASNDLIVLAVSVIFTFLSALGCNLYYSLHNTRIIKELKELEESKNRQLAYNRLIEKFDKYISDKENDKALQLGNYIVQQYKTEVALNPEIIFSILDISNSKTLLFDTETRDKLSYTKKEVG